MKLNDRRCCESIFKCFVNVMAPPELKMLPRLSMLHKGLYGSTKGALNFQVWVDDKLSNIGYSKCQSARSVYIKKGKDGNTVRLLRHSDDFRISMTFEKRATRFSSHNVPAEFLMWHYKYAQGTILIYDHLIMKSHYSPF